MLISAREASEVLGRSGLTRRSAQRVLRCGLAGDPIRTRSAVLFDEDRVHHLVRQREISWGEAMDRCPAGLFVARRDVLVTRPREEQVEVLASGWSAVSTWRLVAMELQIREHGPLAFVATVSGFVVLGAEIVEVRGSRLVLDRLGAWFDPCEGARLSTGPGRPWVLHLGPHAPAPLTERAMGELRGDRSQRPRVPLRRSGPGRDLVA